MRPRPRPRQRLAKLAFMVQLFQAECFIDLDSKDDAAIVPLSPKIVKSTSAANLCSALMHTAAMIFSPESLARLASVALVGGDVPWQYVALHADSLSANLLFEVRLGMSEFARAIVDRVPCYGHQLNLGALESIAALLNHVNPLSDFAQLAGNSVSLGDLLSACRRYAQTADVFRGIPPPQAGRDYCKFLMKHTPPPQLCSADLKLLHFHLNLNRNQRVVTGRPADRSKPGCGRPTPGPGRPIPIALRSLGWILQSKVLLGLQHGLRRRLRGGFKTKP